MDEGRLNLHQRPVSTKYKRMPRECSHHEVSTRTRIARKLNRVWSNKEEFHRGRKGQLEALNLRDVAYGAYCYGEGREVS